MIEWKYFFLQETSSSEPTPTPTGPSLQNRMWVMAVPSTIQRGKAGKGVSLGAPGDNGGDWELRGDKKLDGK